MKPLQSWSLPLAAMVEDAPMERKDVDALPREDRHTEPPTSRRESAKEGTHAKLDTTSDYLRSIIYYYYYY